MRDILTLKELADYLQMSTDSVYHLVRRGKIPGVKIGKQWRFSKAAIDCWLGCGTTRTIRVVVASGKEAKDSILEALRCENRQTIVLEMPQQVRELLSES